VPSLKIYPPPQIWNQILFAFLAVLTQNPFLLHPKGSLVLAMVDTIQCSVFFLLHARKFYICSQTLSPMSSYLANSMNCSTVQICYHGRSVQPILHCAFPSRDYPSLIILVCTTDFL
jgi:hypothetical protein